MADRTLAERAREAAHEAHWPERVTEHADLLTALADENDAQAAEIAESIECEHCDRSVVSGSYPVCAQCYLERCAERDRYWNLAEQLAQMVEAISNQSDTPGEMLRQNALAAFRAEKDSRDV